MIEPSNITALILAGGRGARMGGVDKGLQRFNGQPLALHTLLRLRQQEGGLIGDVLLNANRNLAAYAAFGTPVWPDADLGDFAGPLAGFLTGLAHGTTPWLLTVPCDTPLFPLDLAQRLAQAIAASGADIAVASAPEVAGGPLRPQPVFCLLRAELRPSLRAFTASGGRKIGAWTAQHKTVVAPFDQRGDDPRAFSNANTLAELHSLEQP